MLSYTFSQEFERNLKAFCPTIYTRIQSSTYDSQRCVFCVHFGLICNEMHSYVNAMNNSISLVSFLHYCIFLYIYTLLKRCTHASNLCWFRLAYCLSNAKLIISDCFFTSRTPWIIKNANSLKICMFSLKIILLNVISILWPIFQMVKRFMW